VKSHSTDFGLERTATLQSGFYGVRQALIGCFIPQSRNPAELLILVLVAFANLRKSDSNQLTRLETETCFFGFDEHEQGGVDRFYCGRCFAQQLCAKEKEDLSCLLTELAKHAVKPSAFRNELMWSKVNSGAQFCTANRLLLERGHGTIAKTRAGKPEPF